MAQRYTHRLSHLESRAYEHQAWNTTSLAGCGVLGIAIPRFRNRPPSERRMISGVESLTIGGSVRHPYARGRWPTRFPALLVVFALLMNTWVQCVASVSTPEARMACCTDEDPCPMHQNGRDGASSTDSRVNQAQADACCASAEPWPSTPSSTSHIATFTFAFQSTVLSADLVDIATVRQGCRDVSAISATRVPRHLLLSVLLV